jgi:hypothetical protein
MPCGKGKSIGSMSDAFRGPKFVDSNRNTLKGTSRCMSILAFTNIIPPDLLNTCSVILLDKLIVARLLKIFPSFYGMQMFISALVKAHKLTLILRQIKPVYSLPFYFFRSILILSCHTRLWLPSGLFPSRFPTKIVCTFLFFAVPATCSSHLSPNFITRKTFG